MRKLPVIAGLAFALGGVGSGVYHTTQKAPLEKIPVVQEFTNRLDSLFEAEAGWLRIPQSTRASYIPQNMRADYSVAQAHSEVEHAFQRLETAQGVVNDMSKIPEVSNYLKMDKKEFFSYMAGFFGGIILVSAGLARRRD